MVSFELPSGALWVKPWPRSQVSLAVLLCGVNEHSAKTSAHVLLVNLGSNWLGHSANCGERAREEIRAPAGEQVEMKRKKKNKEKKKKKEK